MRLEVGKTYQSRLNEQVTIVGYAQSVFNQFPFYDDKERLYKEDGHYGLCNDTNSDLIEEIPLSNGSTQQ